MLRYQYVISYINISYINCFMTANAVPAAATANDLADPAYLAALAAAIKDWGRELGFADVRIADVDL